MAEELTTPYEVAFVYDCQICKKGHTEFGRIKQPSVAITHREELKWNLLELVKEKFSKAHPEGKFDISNLVVEEFVDGNKVNVDPQTIRSREVKGEDLTKPPDEKAKKSEEIKPPEKEDPKKKMGFEEIKNVVKVRIAELNGEIKGCEREIKELTMAVTVATQEMVSLKALLEKAEEVETTKVEEKDKK